MEKLFFLAAMFYGLAVHGQIKMNSTGKVAIGSSAPNSSYDLTIGSTSISAATTNTIYVGGTATFGGQQQLIFDWYGYGYRRIRPSLNNTGQLGSSDIAFNNIYTYGFTKISDGRQKENVTKIQGGLKIIKSLNGVKYDFKKEFFIPKDVKKGSSNELNFEKHRKNMLGFIAQDVYKVLPEAVEYDDSTDVYGIDYTKIIPVLVEAIKEQQVVIEQLHADIVKLSKKSNSTARQLDGDNTETDTRDSNNWILQNTPNPTNGATQIEYSISEENGSAFIYVYNMQGTQLKSYAVAGTGSLTIQSGEFKAGMYIYGLVVNGQLVDSKKMILTK